MAVDELRVNVEIGKVLEICRDIEAANAELYWYFAEVFKDHAELTALWQKTAREEENHFRQFGLAIKLRKDTIVDSLRVDGSKAEKTLNVIKTYFDTVKQTPPSKLEALSAAIKIEKGLAAFHLTNAAHFIQESHKKLFAAMMAADKEHLEALQRFYDRLEAE